MKEKNLPGSVKSDVRKDFGLNLSRDVPNHLQNKRNLALVIKNFFQRPDVVQICPDVKKKTKNPSNSQESNQINYQSGHFKTLHKKFISETKLECAYSMFTRIPYYVRKPGPTDWETCLCMTCVNPEMKLEKLYHFKKINCSRR